MPRIPIRSHKGSEEDYSKNKKAQYEALGRFVEAFELMVNEVRGISADCLFSKTKDLRKIKPDDIEWEDWLEEEANQHLLMQIPLHHQAMTAKPLFDVMRAIVAEIVNAPKSPHYEERTLYKNVLGHIDKEYSSLMWKRNDLLHGTWHIGYVSEDDPVASRFYIQRYKTTADGLKSATELPKNAAELLALADRCNEARDWIGHVGFCLWKRSPLAEFFKLDGKEWKLFLKADSVGTTLPKK